MDTKYQFKYETAEELFEFVATWTKADIGSLEARKNVYRLVQGILWAIYHTDEERNAAVHRVLHFVRNYDELIYYKRDAEENQ